MACFGTIIFVPLPLSLVSGVFCLTSVVFAVGQLGDGRPIYRIIITLNVEKHIYIYHYLFICIFIVAVNIHAIFLDGRTGPSFFVLNS